MAKQEEPATSAATVIEPVTANRIDGPDAQPIEREAPAVIDPAPEGDPAPEPTPRDRMMAEIYAKRAKQIEDENAESRRQQGEPEPAPEPEPVVEAVAPVEPKPVEVVPEPPAKRKIKVNGAELEMSEEELIRAAQLGVASQQKFKEAAEIRQQAEEMLRQAKQNSGVSHETTRAPEPAKASTPIVDDAEINRLAQQLTYGDAEQSKAAVRRLLELRPAEGRTDGPTPEQIAAYATQQALATVERQSALNTFAAEHKDILEDRHLTYLAAQNVNALRAHYQQVGVPKSESDLYAEAGKMVRDWKTSLVPKPSAEPTTAPKAAATVSTDRVERKRAASLQQPATTAGAKAKLENNEPRFPTNSEVVEQMRKARHQPAFR